MTRFNTPNIQVPLPEHCFGGSRSPEAPIKLPKGPRSLALEIQIAQVRFTYFKPQSRYYLHTWIPRVSPGGVLLDNGLPRRHFSRRFPTGRCRVAAAQRCSLQTRTRIVLGPGFMVLWGVLAPAVAGLDVCVYYTFTCVYCHFSLLIDAHVFVYKCLHV